MQRRKKGHASATPEQHPRQTMSEDTMKKTLIVFHSRSGYTRRVAQALAQRLDADLDEIRIVQPMAGRQSAGRGIRGPRATTRASRAAFMTT
jgi:hypothetical protein